MDPQSARHQKAAPLEVVRHPLYWGQTRKYLRNISTALLTKPESQTVHVLPTGSPLNTPTRIIHRRFTPQGHLGVEIRGAPGLSACRQSQDPRGLRSPSRE